MKKEYKILTAILTAIVVVPVAISTASYFFSGNFHYFNTYFEGNSFNSEHESIYIDSIEKIITPAQYSSTNNYQGGACYNNYYAMVANNFENILIYDLETNRLVCTVDNIDTAYHNTDYHCNTVAFGNEFYSETDRFPLLYVSMESPKVHSTLVFRIRKLAGFYGVDLVQTIEFPSSKDSGVYLPNSYIDYEEAAIYYAGYTNNSYNKADDNYLKYYKFQLPSLEEKTVKLNLSNSLDIFTLPSETATQGGFISHGYLYQTFAFKSKPMFRIADLENHTVIHEQSLGETTGYYDEFENIATYNGRLYGFGIKSFRIVEYSYIVTSK